MEIDSVFLQIGESGRQQIKYAALLSLVKMYHPLHVLQYSFVARQTDFTCTDTTNKTLASTCNQDSVSHCSSLQYEEDTIIAEWDLVCDQNWYSKMTMSALMFGFLLGSLVLGWLADQIGRKSNLMLTLVGMIVCNLLSAATSSFSVYVISRFLVGFFLAGNVLSCVVLLSELVGPSYRGIYSLALLGSFPVGIMLLSLWASYFRESWRMFSFSVTVVGLPLLLLQRYLVESPRWYLTQNRQAEAEQLLREIARGNGKTGKIEINLRHSGPVQKSEDTVSQIFTNRRLVWVSLILSYCWFVSGLCYYGLTLAAGQIGTDIYTGTALSGLAELPAVAITYYSIEWQGRQFSLFSFLGLTGILCVAIKSLSPAWTPYLALCAKLCIAGAFKTTYILSSEIFATSIRNSALGIVSAIARVGSILAPFVVMLGETSDGFQFFLFGSLCLVGGFFSFWLPETKNKPLPESVKEMLIDKWKKIETQPV